MFAHDDVHATSWLPRRRVEIRTSRAPALLVVIDTEEEFDWNCGFRRENVAVSAMAEIDRAQRIFDAFGLAPCYVVDYPVVDQTGGFERLREICRDGRAVFGAHLHPWVTPPFEEELTRANSFAGNLPPPLEAAKLRRLVERITESLGERPVLYKAGRYGLGANTASALAELGFLVDLSASPPFDFSDEGGPDYSGFTSDPYWFGPGWKLLGVPATGAYVGALAPSSVAHRLHAVANGRALTRLKVPALLSRLRLIDRLHLSPEGYSPDELRRLTRALADLGKSIFVLSFHSPSLKPGCTPYVRSSGDREQFLAALEGYLDFFFAEMRGRPVTPLELRRELLLESGSES
jgi:hypothetical protein